MDMFQKNVVHAKVSLICSRTMVKIIKIGIFRILTIVVMNCCKSRSVLNEDDFIEIWVK